MTLSFFRDADPHTHGGRAHRNAGSGQLNCLVASNQTDVIYGNACTSVDLGGVNIGPQDWSVNEACEIVTQSSYLHLSLSRAASDDV